MSLREITCCSRGTILGSAIARHCTPRATIAGMTRRAVSALLLGAVVMATVAAADDPLGKARQFYNQRLFDAAIEAAEQAHQTPAFADGADLIAARAYLERFRISAVADDLTVARERLRRLNPERFPPRERTEYIVGLGEALYLDNAFGAAAT